ncbi:MAG: 50S ribosomal protein L40e [Nitrososphaeria archaeon]|nr:50S ribosomal protein L40e [Nitrososphaeria archaeon]NIN51626.1 50S ribosomal protein L40e [Nitrososphaeria archaeon]NIQ32111.1 50S ribosomal protein L40e [Nitrososphaeria archaeon]
MALEEVDARRLAQEYRLFYKICRSCGVRNSRRAVKCRRCKSKNLRWKKREMGMKK